MRIRELILLLGVLLMTNLLSARTDSLAYSFFIAGHTYGKAGVNNVGLHPAFKDKFGYIQSREEIAFGVLLGDIVSPDPVAQDWDEVDADIDTLGLPVYFAVGNHDMENRPLFESRYGDTYYSFIYQNDLFVILDPNLDGWSISGLQLEFLQNTIASNSISVDNIFVMFHQLLWWQSDNIYSAVRPNSFAGMSSPTNFWTDIEPLLNSLPNQVVCCAGDFGAAYWSDDFMYDTYDNISFVGTGMGEGIGDNFIVINVNTNKSVSYDLICLNNPELNCFGDLVDYKITSIQENSNPIAVYPNPSSGKFKLEFPQSFIETVQIIALDGQVIWESQVFKHSKLEVDLSHLPKGLYLLRTTGSKLSTTMKIILN